MHQLEIKEDGSTLIDDVVFGFKSQKKLLLSKFPLDFLSLYDKWNLYHAKPCSLSALYKNLMAVSDEYTGSWTSGGRSSTQSIYQQEYEQLSKDHIRRQTRSSSNNKN